MAVPLVYNSCLSDEALDAMVADSITVYQQRDEQAKEREVFENEQQQRKESAQATGEPFEPEEKEWPEIPLQPPITSEVKFVVCLDTLGQDRGFTDDERRFVLRTVDYFKGAWEQSEMRALHSDCDRKI